MGLATVSSRELKNKTGEVLRRVRQGERIAVTNRGRPVALIIPVDEESLLEGGPVAPYEQAWEDLTSTLAETSPEYETWQEAMDRSRRRG